MKFVKFDTNWADEMDVEGFAILDDVQFAQFEQWVSQPRSWYIGTNEGWEDPEDFSQDYTACDISDDEIAVLVKFFPELNRRTVEYKVAGDDTPRSYTTGGEYGHFPPYTDLDD